MFAVQDVNKNITGHTVFAVQDVDKKITGHTVFAVQDVDKKITGHYWKKKNSSGSSERLQNGITKRCCPIVNHIQHIPCPNTLGNSSLKNVLNVIIL